MSRKRFFVMLSVVFAGCFSGAYFGGMAPASRAEAQIPPVKIQDVRVVPNEGLTFTSEEGRPLAMFSNAGGNGAITLYDAQGAPSVYLSASPGGAVRLEGQAGGGQLLIGRSGSAQTVMQANEAGARLSMQRANQNTVFDIGGGAAGASMTLAAGTGPKLEVILGSAASVKLTARNGQSAFVLNGGSEGSTLSLAAKSGQTGLLLSGEQGIQILKGNQTVWQAPPKQ